MSKKIATNDKNLTVSTHTHTELEILVRQV